MKAWKSKIIDGLELMKQGCAEAFEDDAYCCFECPWVGCCTTLQTDEMKYVEPRKYSLDDLRESHEIIDGGI